MTDDSIAEQLIQFRMCNPAAQAMDDATAISIMAEWDGKPYIPRTRTPEQDEEERESFQEYAAEAAVAPPCTGMTTERYLQLMRDDNTKLTAEELAAGWHFCPEFDGLLTQGEKGPRECYCGTFKDGMWYSSTPSPPPSAADAPTKSYADAGLDACMEDADSPGDCGPTPQQAKPHPAVGQVWQTSDGEAYLLSDTYLETFRLIYSNQLLTSGLSAIGEPAPDDTYLGLWDGTFNVQNATQPAADSEDTRTVDMIRGNLPAFRAVVDKVKQGQVITPEDIAKSAAWLLGVMTAHEHILVLDNTAVDIPDSQA